MQGWEVNYIQYGAKSFRVSAGVCAEIAVSERLFVWEKHLTHTETFGSGR